MPWQETVARLKREVGQFIEGHVNHPVAAQTQAQEQAFDALESATNADQARFGANRVRAYCETLRSPAMVEEQWGGLLAEAEKGPAKKKGK